MLRPATVAIPRLGNLVETPKSIADGELLVLSLEREIRSIEIDLINSGSRLEFDFQGDDLRWSKWEAERRKKALELLQQKTALQGWLILQEYKSRQSTGNELPANSNILAIRKSQSSEQDEEMIKELRQEIALLREEVIDLKQQVEEQSRLHKKVDNLSKVLEATIRQFLDYLHTQGMQTSTRWALSTLPSYIKSLRKRRDGDKEDIGFAEKVYLYNFLIAQGHNPPFSAATLEKGAEDIKQASYREQLKRPVERKLINY